MTMTRAESVEDLLQRVCRAAAGVWELKVPEYTKTVVISGAGSGIGRALAIGFSRDGQRVIGLGRSEPGLVETGGLAAPGTFDYRLVDIADAAAVEAVFRDIGPVDVLVNNAAVYPREFFLDQSAADWTAVILTNLCGPAYCCRACLPGMLARNHGRIINVGSLADWWPIPAASAYSASKGGLHALTKALAAEIDPVRYPDVLVNEMLPRATRTSMSAQGDSPDALYPLARRMAGFPAGGPTGRMFNPEREIVANEGLRARLTRMLRGRRTRL